MTLRIAENPALDRRIADDPGDLDAYLVYADWLQGQGDPRGELITIQHALVDQPNNYDLIKAESHLIHQHPGHFLPEELLGLGNAEWRWRLGFLQSATIRGNQSALEQLLVHPSAKFLAGLSCDAWQDAEALARCLLEHGARPTLANLRIESAVAPVIAQTFWQRCPRLESLALDHDFGPVLDELVHPALRSLRLRAAWLAFDLEPLLDASALPGLRELTLQAGNSEQLSSLVPSKLLASLERLTLKSCGLRDADAQLILQNASRFAHLERLSLEGNSFDRTEPQLAELGSWVDVGYQHFDATLLYEPNLE